jgi:hypothetical protein
VGFVEQVALANVAADHVAERWPDWFMMSRSKAAGCGAGDQASP